MTVPLFARKLALGSRVRAWRGAPPPGRQGSGLVPDRMSNPLTPEPQAKPKAPQATSPLKLHPDAARSLAMRPPRATGPVKNMRAGAEGDKTTLSPHLRVPGAGRRPYGARARVLSLITALAGKTGDRTEHSSQSPTGGVSRSTLRRLRLRRVPLPQQGEDRDARTQQRERSPPTRPRGTPRPARSSAPRAGRRRGCRSRGASARPRDRRRGPRPAPPRRRAGRRPRSAAS